MYGLFAESFFQPNMGSDNFCLRWNDFEHNINSSLKELRDEKDFFDVTLACEGDDQIQAHKLILSACSPFFKHLLRRHSHQHPLLYLRGIKHKELQNIINFMYYGEVNVAQADLNSFLSVSEELQVKGLTQDYKTDARNKAQHKNKSSRLNPDFDNDINDTTSETLCVKMEPPVLDSGSKTKHPPSVPFQHNEISGVFDDNYDEYTNYEDYSMDTVATGQENNKGELLMSKNIVKPQVQLFKNGTKVDSISNKASLYLCQKLLFTSTLNTFLGYPVAVTC